jgi:hypothetical protein
MSPAVKPPAAPVSISDRNCLEATGLAPRAWRRALVELNIPHARVGRRTVCTVGAWLAAIERASGAASRPASAHTRVEIVALAATGKR